ncbi:hypothetical protein GVN24_30785 [Rhizobium sp. CRIBSB]|nr:hypothetical protein [Rhizobium sp. CRIBSB]
MSRSLVFRSQRNRSFATAALLSCLVLVAACSPAAEEPETAAADAAAEKPPVTGPATVAADAEPVVPAPATATAAAITPVTMTSTPRPMMPRSETPAAEDVAGPRPVAVQTAGLPAGPGRDTTMRLCSNCHTIDTVTARGRTGAEWGEIITQMTNLGLNASDADLDEVQAYLTRSLPPR